jgi:hypothetical protein
MVDADVGVAVAGSEQIKIFGAVGQERLKKAESQSLALANSIL